MNEDLIYKFVNQSINPSESYNDLDIDVMHFAEFITICKSTVNDAQDYEDMDEYEKGWADSADRIIELSTKHFGIQ